MIWKTASKRCINHYLFPTISNILASASNSISTSVFFKHACWANLGVERTEQDLVHKFTGTCFWNFWIYLQTVGYRSVHIGCDINLDFVIQNFTRRWLFLTTSVILSIVWLLQESFFVRFFSFQVIHILKWISTYLKHEASFWNLREVLLMSQSQNWHVLSNL